jgi:hypothetical protein
MVADNPALALPRRTEPENLKHTALLNANPHPQADKRCGHPQLDEEGFVIPEPAPSHPVVGADAATPKVLPVCYASMYMGLVPVAMEHGYALSMHGSLKRDLDLIAVPWVEEACEAERLVEAIAQHVTGFFVKNDYPNMKPHGRRAWSIHLGGGPYLDISVMPRIKDCVSIRDYDALCGLLGDYKQKLERLERSKEE